MEEYHYQSDWPPQTPPQVVKKDKLPIITILLVVVNIIVFLLCTPMGNMMYNVGSLSIVYVIGNGEYYRLISCMFLHAGIEHLFNNMLMLYFLGSMLEKEVGHVFYLVLYFIAGIGSGIVSMLYEYITGQVMLSVGASGAIFGIIGAMLLLIIIHKGRYGGISLRRMIIGIIYMLYSGFRNPTVNNAAHIGGLVCGFFIALLQYIGKALVKRDEN